MLSRNFNVKTIKIRNGSDKEKFKNPRYLKKRNIYEVCSSTSTSWRRCGLKGYRAFLPTCAGTIIVFIFIEHFMSIVRMLNCKSKLNRFLMKITLLRFMF